MVGEVPTGVAAEPGVATPALSLVSSSRASSVWRRARSRSRVRRSISAASLAGETSIAAARCWARVGLSMFSVIPRSVVQVVPEPVHEPRDETDGADGLGIGEPGGPEHPDDPDGDVGAAVRRQHEGDLAHIRRLDLRADEHGDTAGLGDVADELAEIGPVLERVEDATQLLAVGE